MSRSSGYDNPSDFNSEHGARFYAYENDQEYLLSQPFTCVDDNLII